MKNYNSDYQGVTIYKSSYTTVKDNDFLGGECAIWMYGATSYKIIYNNFNNYNSLNIGIMSSEFNLIHHNKIYGTITSSTGILLSTTRFNRIHHNCFRENLNDVELETSTRDTIYLNNIDTNKIQLRQPLFQISIGFHPLNWWGIPSEPRERIFAPTCFVLFLPWSPVEIPDICN